tara:strand:+ start:66 stop:263 length:198 start_codon:yes stop_codon:yes gene_type:complete
MQKTYSYKNKLSQNFKVEKKNTVDINILLNRVKIEKKNEIKRKFFFFSFSTLAVSLFGFFIVNIK